MFARSSFAAFGTVLATLGLWVLISADARAQSGWKKNSAGHDVYQYKPQTTQPDWTQPKPAAPSRTAAEPEKQCPPGSHLMAPIGGERYCSTVVTPAEPPPKAEPTPPPASGEPAREMTQPRYGTSPEDVARLRGLAKGELRWTAHAVEAGLYQDIWAASAASLYAVSGEGIYQSSDGAVTWRATARDHDFSNGVWGTSDQDVYVVGETIRHSADGGATWQEQGVDLKVQLAKELGHSMSLQDVRGSETHVYAVGKAGVVLHSEDRGRTWSRRSSGVSTHLNAVWADGKKAYAVGDRGVILVSSDAGGTWKLQRSGTTKDVSAIWGAPGGRDIYAAGSDATLLHSKGDGKWRRLSLPPSIPFTVTDIWGASAKELFCAIGQRILLHTTDGGAHWLNESVGLTDYLGSIWGLSAQEIFLTGGVMARGTSPARRDSPAAPQGPSKGNDSANLLQYFK